MTQSAEDFFHQTKALREKGALTAAEDHALKGLAAHPHVAALWDEYGRVLYLQEAYAACVVAFQKSYGLKPTPSRAFSPGEPTSPRATAFEGPDIGGNPNR